MAGQPDLSGLAEFVEVAHRSGQLLLQLLNDVLDLSKAETTSVQLTDRPFSPAELAGDVVAALQPVAARKRLDLDLVVRRDDVLGGDPSRLRQVLMNLVGNAVKFTEHGGVRVDVDVTPGAGDRVLRVSVADTGAGMAAGEVERVFTPFVQGDSSTTRRFGGSGLGLAIAQRMARLLGGDVTIASELGKGSTVTVTIGTGPLDGVQRVDLSEGCPPPEPPPLPSLPQPRPSLDGRILLVEDGPDNQRLLSLILGRTGAEVTVVNNGKEALEKALPGGLDSAGVSAQAARPFDVILMDMQMPVMDGYEATRRLREAGYRDPIIALTAHAMKGDREKCLAAGCDDYLAKPVDQDLLVETVARYVTASTIH